MSSVPFLHDAAQMKDQVIIKMHPSCNGSFLAMGEGMHEATTAQQ